MLFTELILLTDALYKPNISRCFRTCPPSSQGTPSPTKSPPLQLVWLPAPSFLSQLSFTLFETYAAGLLSSLHLLIIPSLNSDHHATLHYCASRIPRRCFCSFCSSIGPCGSFGCDGWWWRWSCEFSYSYSKELHHVLTFHPSSPLEAIKPPTRFPTKIVPITLCKVQSSTSSPFNSTTLVSARPRWATPWTASSTTLAKPLRTGTSSNTEAERAARSALTMTSRRSCMPGASWARSAA